MSASSEDTTRAAAAKPPGGDGPDFAGQLDRRPVRECRRLVTGILRGFRADAEDGEKVVRYTQGQHVAITRMFADVMAELVVANRDLADLRARIGQLEARPIGIDYRGLWHAGTYPAGSFVTLGGSLWRAKCATRQEPGVGADWALVVSRGKTGRAAPKAPGR